jgi:hypothetical protein
MLGHNLCRWRVQFWQRMLYDIRSSQGLQNFKDEDGKSPAVAQVMNLMKLFHPSSQTSTLLRTMIPSRILDTYLITAL